MAQEQRETILVGVSLDPPPLNNLGYKSQHCPENFLRLVEKLFQKYPAKDYQLIFLIGDSFQRFRITLEALKVNPTVKLDQSEFADAITNLTHAWMQHDQIKTALSMIEAENHRIVNYSAIERDARVSEWYEKIGESYRQGIGRLRDSINSDAKSYLNRYKNNNVVANETLPEEQAHKVCVAAKLHEYAVILVLGIHFQITTMSYAQKKGKMPIGLSTVRKLFLGEQYAGVLKQWDNTYVENSISYTNVLGQLARSGLASSKKIPITGKPLRKKIRRTSSDISPNRVREELPLGAKSAPSSPPTPLQLATAFITAGIAGVASTPGLSPKTASMLVKMLIKYTREEFLDTSSLDQESSKLIMDNELGPLVEQDMGFTR